MMDYLVVAEEISEDSRDFLSFLSNFKKMFFSFFKTIRCQIFYNLLDMKNMKRKVITSAVLLTVLAGAPVAGKVLSQVGNEFQETIQLKKEAKRIDPETSAVVIDPGVKDTGVTVSITEPYNASTNEMGITWTVDIDALNKAVNDAWTSDNTTRVSFMRIMFVDSAKFSEYYPGGAFTDINPNSLDPWNDKLWSGYDSEDSSTLGRWGVDIGIDGLINDWMTSYDTDGDGNGIDDIPTDFDDDKANAPIMQIRNGYTYKPNDNAWDYELDPSVSPQTKGQFARGSIVPTGDVAIASGSATIRNLRPGLNYDQIAIVGTTRDTVNDAVSDYVPDSIDGGFANSIFTGGGTNFLINPQNIDGDATINVDPSSQATPKIEAITPEGETDWYNFSTPTTEDGVTGNVDATINYQVMEDAEQGNFNNSKTNITGITIASDSTGPFVLTEADFDDAVDSAVQENYENPYNGLIIDAELPDPNATPDYTQHSYTLEGLETNTTYNFTATVDYESNVNALSMLEEYEGDSDAGLYVYNDIGGGETTPVMDSEEITFSFTTPDLGIAEAPIVTPNAPTVGDTPQTDVEYSFEINDHAGSDAGDAYNPVITDVVLNSTVINGGSIDVTDNRVDGSDLYTVTLDETNSTIEGGQPIDDVTLDVSYTINGDADTLSSIAFDSITTASKLETSIDTPTTTVGEVTPTTATIDYSFNVVEEDNINNGTTPTKIEVIDADGTSVSTAADIPTAVDGVVSGSITIEELPASTTISDYSLKVTYDSGDEYKDKYVTSNPFGFDTIAKADPSEPTFTNASAETTQNSATITFSDPSLIETTEDDVTRGRKINSITASSATVDAIDGAVITPVSLDKTTTGEASVTINSLSSDTEISDLAINIDWSSVENGSSIDQEPVSVSIDSFTTEQKIALDAPTITTADVAEPGSDSATVAIQGTGFIEATETTETAGRVIDSVETDIDGVTSDSFNIADENNITLNLIDLTDNTPYSGNVVLTYHDVIDGEDQTSATVTSTLDFTTAADQELAILGNGEFKGVSSNNATITVEFDGTSASAAETKLKTAEISYNGTKVDSEYISNDSTSGNTIATYEISNLNERESYNADGWSYKLPTQGYEADLTLNEGFTTGYADEAFLNTTYGINIIDNSFKGSSFTAELLFDSVIKNESTMDNIAIDATGLGDIQTSYVSGTMNNNVIGGKTVATFEVSGLDPLETYSNWTVTTLNNEYLSSASRSSYNEDDLATIDTKLNQFPIRPGDIIEGNGGIGLDTDGDGKIDIPLKEDEDGNFGLDLNGDGIIDLPLGNKDDEGGNISLDLPEFIGEIDIDGDANKDDSIISWPDGSISIAIDGDLSNQITINLPDVITDENGDYGIDLDGDGSVDVPYIDNGDGTGGFDLDGDGTIDLPYIDNGDGTGGFDLDGGGIDIPTTGGHVDLGDGGIVLKPDENGNIGFDVGGDGIVDFPLWSLGISIKIPDGLWGLGEGTISLKPGGDGGFVIVIDNGGNEVGTIIPGGDGGFVILPPSTIITDPGGNTGIDVDGDGTVDLPIIIGEDGKPAIDIDGDDKGDVVIPDGIITKPDENGNVGLDIGGDGTVDLPIITDENGNYGIDLDGDGLVDIPSLGGLIDGGLDLDGDGLPDFNLDLDIDGYDPTQPAGYENEAIVDIDAGLKVLPEEIKQESFLVEVKFKGNMTDDYAQEFQDVQIKYTGPNGEGVSSRLVSASKTASLTLVYEISGLTENTTYDKTQWSITSLDPEYLGTVSSTETRASEASENYITSSISLSEDVTTTSYKKISLKWLWILLLIVLVLSIIGVIVWFVMHRHYESSVINSKHEEKHKETKDEHDNRVNSLLSKLPKSELLAMACVIYDKASLADYDKSDLINLLLDEDIDSLIEQAHDPKKETLSKMTKAQLMKLATQVYDKDTLVDYEKDDLVNLLFEDEDIQV